MLRNWIVPIVMVLAIGSGFALWYKGDGTKREPTPSVEKTTKAETQKQEEVAKVTPPPSAPEPQKESKSVETLAEKPKEAGPVPGLTDPVLSSVQQTEVKTDPPAITPAPADPPPAPVQADVPKAETPAPTVINQPPAEEKKPEAAPKSDSVEEDGYRRVAYDGDDESSETDETDTEEPFKVREDNGTEEADVEEEPFAVRDSDPTEVDEPEVFTASSGDDYEEPHNITDEVRKRKGDYADDHDHGPRRWCPPRCPRHHHHHYHPSYRNYGGFDAWVVEARSGYPRGISIGFGPARVGRQQNRRRW